MLRTCNLEITKNIFSGIIDPSNLPNSHQIKRIAKISFIDSMGGSKLMYYEYLEENLQPWHVFPSQVKNIDLAIQDETIHESAIFIIHIDNLNEYD